MDDLTTIDELEEEYNVQREYYPQEVSVDEFIDILKDSLPAFEDNIQGLGLSNRYPEEWMRLFTKWMELESE